MFVTPVPRPYGQDPVILRALKSALSTAPVVRVSGGRRIACISGGFYLLPGLSRVRLSTDEMEALEGAALFHQQIEMFPGTQGLVQIPLGSEEK